MLRLSASGRGSSILSQSLSAGCDSPVRVDSSILKSSEEIIRESAGTISPASNTIMSPGTTSCAETVSRAPSLKTFAFGAESFFRVSKTFSAFSSWEKPITPFKTTIANIATASTHSERNPATTAAPIRTSIINSVNCFRNFTRRASFFGSLSRFRPYLERRSSASPAVRPPLEELSSSRTSSALLLCHSTLNKTSGQMPPLLPFPGSPHSPHALPPPSTGFPSTLIPPFIIVHFILCLIQKPLCPDKLGGKYSETQRYHDKGRAGKRYQRNPG